MSSKTKIQPVASESPQRTPSKKEVLDEYKEDYRRKRAQMKAKLIRECMARLKAERAKQKQAKEKNNQKNFYY